MKAIRIHAFGGPEVMKLATIPDPEPVAGQVLVRLGAAGVNPVDTYIRSGAYARLPELPYTPGSDGSGIILKIGPGVSPEWKPGTRVWLSGSVTGTYADAALCEVAHLHQLPDGITFSQGAALGTPYGTAYRALFHRGGAKPGETVLIHGGTGGVGVAAVQLARLRGLRVLATGGSEAGRAMLLAQGAEVFDHTALGYTDEILQSTGGRGVDLIVEALANVNLGKDLALLARGGRVAVVGSRGPVEINPRDAMMREADVRGIFVAGASAAELAEAWASVESGLRSGALAPAIGEEIPLAEAPRAHETVMGGGHRGKIVLRCSEEVGK